MPGDSYPGFCAAVIQAKSIYLDRYADVEKAIGLIGKAEAGGVKLLTFGET